MNKNGVVLLKTQFDGILNVMVDSKIEFWYARDLMTVLGYSQCENFISVIEKSLIACNNSGIEVGNHFRDVAKMVDLGSGSKREIVDIVLTRYVCYLMRRQEVLEEHIAYQERLKARQKLTESETKLSKNI